MFFLGQWIFFLPNPKKNLDILEIDLVEITDQYIAYIDLMEDFEYELAGDYLAMAAYLAEINREFFYQDPKKLMKRMGSQSRAFEKITRYQRFKEVSAKIDAIPRVDRDIFPASSQYLNSSFQSRE